MSILAPINVYPVVFFCLEKDLFWQRYLAERAFPVRDKNFFVRQDVRSPHPIHSNHPKLLTLPFPTELPLAAVKVVVKKVIAIEGHADTLLLLMALTVFYAPLK